jgi:hypothetical protein
MIGFIIVLVGVVLKDEQKSGAASSLFSGFGNAFGGILGALEQAG